MAFKVLTWNISYAYGLGSEGDDRYHPKARTHFETTLHAMGDLIRGLNPDVVLLQEVDFHSKRSHFLPQLEILSRRSGLLYRRSIVSWNRLYVPFPGLSPRRHFGAVCSGGGVLSKTPITPLQDDLLAKPRENSRIYNFFYLHRYLQIFETSGLRLANLHLEAFSEDNRELHLIRLQDRLHEFEIDLAGGDFNGPVRLKPEVLSLWSPAAPPSGTFPSNLPLHPLDQFMIRRSKILSPELKVIESGTLSDHLPVLLEFDLKERAPEATSLERGVRPR